MPKFSHRSKKRLKSCHKDLQKLMNEVIKYYDISILEGHRDKMAQEDAFNMGASRAHFGESLHNSKPSMAVDIAFWPISWQDLKEFHYMAGLVEGIASQMKIEIKWGGRFSFFDGPHFELKRRK